MDAVAMAPERLRKLVRRDLIVTADRQPDRDLDVQPGRGRGVRIRSRS